MMGILNNNFGKPIIPANEKERLKALHSLNILPSLPERFFDNLALIVAKTFDAPIALISLVDAEQVIFKANVGMPGVRTVERGTSFCSLAVLEEQPTIIEDALEDPCVMSNPLVAGEFGLRFYAGAPIKTPEGYNIGTVCIVDKTPRHFSDDDQQLLKQFATSAMDAIMERKKNLMAL